MSLLLDELRSLGANPVAWAAVPVIAGFTLRSYYHWRHCPLLHKTRDLTHEEATEFLRRPQIAGPRYLLLMLAGMGATIAGLALIAKGVGSALAFYLLVAGVFVIQTEPARLQVREAEYRVLAAQPYGQAAERAAIERLDWTNGWLVTLQLVILTATLAFLLAF